MSPVAEDDQSRRFRRNAEDARQLAENAEIGDQQGYHLKIATMWFHAAIKWEYRLALSARMTQNKLESAQAKADSRQPTADSRQAELTYETEAKRIKPFGA